MIHYQNKNTLDKLMEKLSDLKAREDFQKEEKKYEQIYKGFMIITFILVMTNAFTPCPITELTVVLYISEVFVLILLIQTFYKINKSMMQDFNKEYEQ